MNSSEVLRVVTQRQDRTRERLCARSCQSDSGAWATERDASGFLDAGQRSDAYGVVLGPDPRSVLDLGEQQHQVAAQLEGECREFVRIGTLIGRVQQPGGDSEAVL